MEDLQVKKDARSILCLLMKNRLLLSTGWHIRGDCDVGEREVLSPGGNKAETDKIRERAWEQNAKASKEK